MIDTTQPLQEQRAEFAELLGLEEPVEEKVLLAALENQTYAHNLLTTRDTPEFLDRLLKKPPIVHKPAKSNTDLIKSATTALINWKKAGFSVVDQGTLERRENACLSCEHLKKPDKMLQKLVTSSAKEEIGKRAADCVCNLCGCSISKKIKLPSESCPAVSKNNPKLNRWEEPIKS